MNKETLILVIAQNGLKAAATLFVSKADKLAKQAEKSKDDKETAKINKSAAKAKKLASILVAADQGITSYLAEPEA